MVLIPERLCRSWEGRTHFLGRPCQGDLGPLCPQRRSLPFPAWFWVPEAEPGMGTPTGSAGARPPADRHVGGRGARGYPPPPPWVAALLSGCGSQRVGPGLP